MGIVRLCACANVKAPISLRRIQRGLADLRPLSRHVNGHNVAFRDRILRERDGGVIL